MSPETTCGPIRSQKKSLKKTKLSGVFKKNPRGERFDRLQPLRKRLHNVQAASKPVEPDQKGGLCQDLFAENSGFFEFSSAEGFCFFGFIFSRLF